MGCLLKKHFTGARIISVLKFSCLQEEDCCILEYGKIRYLALIMIMNRVTGMATDRTLGSTGLDGSKNTDFAILKFNVFNAEFRKVNKVIYFNK
jgi:hypothetical protein